MVASEVHSSGAIRKCNQRENKVRVAAAAAAEERAFEPSIAQFFMPFNLAMHF